MVLYAFATSRTEACEPEGSQAMSKAMVENVPQVQGKLSPLMWELIEVVWGDGLCSYVGVKNCEQLSKHPGLIFWVQEIKGTTEKGPVPVQVGAG